MLLNEVNDLSELVFTGNFSIKVEKEPLDFILPELRDPEYFIIR